MWDKIRRFMITWGETAVYQANWVELHLQGDGFPGKSYRKPWLFYVFFFFPRQWGGCCSDTTWILMILRYFKKNFMSLCEWPCGVCEIISRGVDYNLLCAGRERDRHMNACARIYVAFMCAYWQIGRWIGRKRVRVPHIPHTLCIIPSDLVIIMSSSVTASGLVIVDFPPWAISGSFTDAWAPTECCGRWGGQNRPFIAEISWGQEIFSRYSFDMLRQPLGWNNMIL